MTRENKLALVIGFGLLLLAGILVSDHLSSGQRSGEEPLLASGEQVVPPSTLLQSRGEHVRRTEQATSAPPNASTGRNVASTRQTATEPAPLRQITIGGGSPNTASGTATVKTTSSITKQPTVHYVRKGETLSAISKKYYGNSEYANAIARSNNISNPQRIRVGTRLVIADQPGGSIRSQQTLAAAPPKANSRPERRMVKVQEGETLSEIAKRELGSERKWHELWQLNKKVVPNPDRLRPGTTLNLPAT